MKYYLHCLTLNKIRESPLVQLGILDCVLIVLLELFATVIPVPSGQGAEDNDETSKPFWTTDEKPCGLPC